MNKMASTYFKRLVDKYGSDSLKGQRYNAMIKEVLAHNNIKAGRAVGRIENQQYLDQAKRISKTNKKTLKLPDLTEVLPKRSVFLIKSADSGQAISMSLRTALEKDLRDTLNKFQAEGKQKMEFQAGRGTGKINPELVKEFQKSIIQTYESRTKRDPRTGVPPSVRNIAVTEIRSTVGMIKDNYKETMLKKNPNLRAMKTWIHNRRLSKHPRLSHMEHNYHTIGDKEKFKVSSPKRAGFDLMDRPHDIKAPLDQVIGCSCDIVYKLIFA